jgi:ABC-type uncharacterized transport system permease subunit
MAIDAGAYAVLYLLVVGCCLACAVCVWFHSRMTERWTRHLLAGVALLLGAIVVTGAVVLAVLAEYVG